MKRCLFKIRNVNMVDGKRTLDIFFDIFCSFITKYTDTNGAAHDAFRERSGDRLLHL